MICNNFLSFLEIPATLTALVKSQDVQMLIVAVFITLTFKCVNMHVFVPCKKSDGDKQVLYSNVVQERS